MPEKKGENGKASLHRRQRSRIAECVAAHADNPYAEAVLSRVITTPVGLVARGAVRNDAVAAVHGPIPYGDGYAQGVTTVSVGAVDRAAVRAPSVSLT